MRQKLISLDGTLYDAVRLVASGFRKGWIRFQPEQQASTPSLHGIRYQTEAARLEARRASMKRAMQRYTERHGKTQHGKRK